MSEFEDKINPGEGNTQAFSDLMKKVAERNQEKQIIDGGQPEQPDYIENQDNVLIKQVPEQEIRKVEFAELKVEPKEEPSQKQAEPILPVSEVGVISSATTITGRVSSRGHIRVEGEILGNVFALGDIKVTGKIIGNLDGSNVELVSCNVEGDVKARGDVLVGKESILKGDLNGQLITIDGKVQGNIEAQKGAHMSDASKVKGSISSPTLSMSSGAEIQGKVNVSKDEN